MNNLNDAIFFLHGIYHKLNKGVYNNIPKEDKDSLELCNKAAELVKNLREQLIEKGEITLEEDILNSEGWRVE